MTLGKKLSYFILVILFTLSIVSCAKNEDTQVSEDMDTIRLVMLPYFSNTVFQIAIGEGYFEEQGIIIEVVNLQSDRELVPLILSGDVDAGAPGLSAGLFNGFSKGGEMKVILPLSQFQAGDCSYIAFLARQEDVEAKIYENKANWVNASMVISSQGLNSIPGYVLSEVLADSGVTIDDMDVKRVEIPAYEDALLSGQVDIIYGIEPTLTRLTDNDQITILEPGDIHVDGLAVSVVTVGPKIYENEDLANRFSIAYLKAVRQYLEGPTERNIEQAATLTGQEKEVVSGICWSYSSPNGIINAESIDAFQNFLLDRGLLDEFTEIEKYYDPSFAEFAVRYLDGE